MSKPIGFDYLDTPSGEQSGEAKTEKVSKLRSAENAPLDDEVVHHPYWGQGRWDDWLIR